MWAWIARKAVAFGVGRLATWGAAAVASAAVLWLWNDYQDAKARVVTLRTQVESAAEIQRETVRLAAARESQLRADLVAARATSERRGADALTLQRELEEIRKIKAPEHETIHPAIAYALDRLRQSRVDGVAGGRVPSP